MPAGYGYGRVGGGGRPLPVGVAAAALVGSGLGEGRFLVRSPKTEHHEGGAERWVPIFPELRPHLEEAFERAEEGSVFLIARYRDANVNCGPGCCASSAAPASPPGRNSSTTCGRAGRRSWRRITRCTSPAPGSATAPWWRRGTTCK
jgi:hypothetical protein